ncbi:hypothetical protein RYX36_009217 [Vicia faba]
MGFLCPIFSQNMPLVTKRFDNITKPSTDLFDNGEHSNSFKNDIVEVLPEKVKEFSCLYCNKKFSSAQVLGGHQNTYKHEFDSKKNEQKMREEEMDSSLMSRSSFTHFYPYASPIHYQEYPRFHGNFQQPIGTHMNNNVPSWLDSSFVGYGGMYMPNTPSPPHPFVMPIPKPPITTPQFEMTNFFGRQSNVCAANFSMVKYCGV